MDATFTVWGDRTQPYLDSVPRQEAEEFIKNSDLPGIYMANDQTGEDYVWDAVSEEWREE